MTVHSTQYKTEQFW